MNEAQRSTGQWNPDYQRRDWEIVDYHEYRLPGIDISFRGPAIDPKLGRYFTCMGAAQTYGVWVDKPYPELLSERLGLPALNLGLPAVTPRFYANLPAAINYANRGLFLVLQVMSSRAEPNRYYDAVGWRETVRDRDSGELVPSMQSWKRLIAEKAGELPAIARENQISWIESNRMLISQIKVPIILLWFSHERRADERIDFSHASFDDLYMRFPQFVDANCLGPVQAMCDAFVACESRRNYGHPLISRFTGEPVGADNGWLDPAGAGQILTHNHYYPSLEMHEDAAAALLGPIQDVLQGQENN